MTGRIRQHIGRPDAAPTILQGASAAEILSASEKLGRLIDVNASLALVERADLRPGLLTLRLDNDALSQAIGCASDRINPECLIIEAPFRTRRRGVELKLHLGKATPDVDQTLVRNIVKGRRWLAMIVEGKTFAEIAAAEGVSKRRIQDVVGLALLAPDVLEAIASGAQSEGLTTDHLIKTGFNPVWSEQRTQFAAL